MSRDTGTREDMRWQEEESVGHWGQSYEFRPRGICTLLKRVAQTDRSKTGAGNYIRVKPRCG